MIKTRRRVARITAMEPPRELAISKRLWLLAGLLWAGVCAGEASGGVNDPSQVAKPYLILVSIDGFRWDYSRRFDTPALDRIAANGVRAAALIPVYPTLTFPNHYSIATGLYPANHGLVGNRFPSKDRRHFFSLHDRSTVEDGSWYAGEPVWVAAERHGLVSAAFFFVGTEADVAGIRPTHWQTFNPAIAAVRRVDQAIAWLSMPAERRPHVITLYFEDVDDASHDYGIDSPQTAAAIERVDGYVERLLEGLESLPIADRVYVVVVSDHGQSSYRRELQTFIIDEVVDLEGVRSVDHGPVSFLYFDEPDAARAAAICEAINARWRRGRAVVPDDAPERWQTTGGSRFADVIVQADARAAVRSTRDPAHGLSLGDHGWAPDFSDMHGIFVAMGPRLPKGRRIGAIDAVDVYPLLMEILDLPISGPIDGDPEALVPLLTEAQ